MTKKQKWTLQKRKLKKRKSSTLTQGVEWGLWRPNIASYLCKQRFSNSYSFVFITPILPLVIRVLSIS